MEDDEDGEKERWRDCVKQVVVCREWKELAVALRCRHEATKRATVRAQETKKERDVGVSCRQVCSCEQWERVLSVSSPSLPSLSDELTVARRVVLQ